MQMVSEDVAAVWTRVRDELEASLPDSTFRLWLRPLELVSADGEAIYLSAPDGIRAWVERRYGGAIAAILRRQDTPLRRVGFVALVGRDETAADHTIGPRGFEDFVIGTANRFAHAAALATAEIPGEAYNPLFLHGPPGVGKTHLLAAIAGYLGLRHPGLIVRYTTAERFTSEFVAAVRGGRGEAFKNSWREVDALLIDDVQFLEDKSRTGEEFFHTFEALHQRGCQIVLSSDRPPRSLSRLAERLRDRFEWGLCAQLDPPDLDTRIAVLTQLDETSEVTFEPGDKAALMREIASHCANLRQLEGALTRVVAFSSVMDSEPTVALVRDVLDVDRVDESPGATEQSPTRRRRADPGGSLLGAAHLPRRVDVQEPNPRTRSRSPVGDLRHSRASIAVAERAREDVRP